MKIILLVLFLTITSASYAETLVSKTPRDRTGQVGALASYKCMSWLNTGSMKINKNSNKASFSNGYLKFNKNAKINALLSMPADVYCVGDRVIFTKTFGRSAATITNININ